MKWTTTDGLVCHKQSLRGVSGLFNQYLNKVEDLYGYFHLAKANRMIDKRVVRSKPSNAIGLPFSGKLLSRPIP